MKSLIAFALCAGMGTAVAAPVFTTHDGSSSSHFDLGTGNTVRDANGDTADTVVALFTTATGAPSVGPLSHTIGTTDNAADAFSNPFTVTSTDVDNFDGTRTLTISWIADNFANTIPVGANIGGLPITTISFELGQGNAGTDTVDPVGYAGLPGDGTFDLIGAGGAVLFSGSYFMTDTGTGFSGTTFVSAGGADLSGFGIAGGIATITYNVPAPAGAALLGLGGLVAVRRRR